MRIFLKLLSARKVNDPERAILPALVYTKMQDDVSQVRMISIGWWAWGVGIVFLTKNVEQN